MQKEYQLSRGPAHNYGKAIAATAPLAASCFIGCGGTPEIPFDQSMLERNPNFPARIFEHAMQHGEYLEQEGTHSWILEQPLEAGYNSEVTARYGNNGFVLSVQLFREDSRGSVRYEFIDSKLDGILDRGAQYSGNSSVEQSFPNEQQEYRWVLQQLATELFDGGMDITTGAAVPENYTPPQTQPQRQAENQLERQVYENDTISASIFTQAWNEGEPIQELPDGFSEIRHYQPSSNQGQTHYWYEARRADDETATLVIHASSPAGTYAYHDSGLDDLLDQRMKRDTNGEYQENIGDSSYQPQYAQILQDIARILQAEPAPSEE